MDERGQCVAMVAPDSREQLPDWLLRTQVRRERVRWFSPAAKVGGSCLDVCFVPIDQKDGKSIIHESARDGFADLAGPSDSSEQCIAHLATISQSYR